MPQEFTQEFEDESAASLMDLDLFDTSGDYDYEGSADVPDGKIDFDEFKAAARKIPGIYGTFPGISDFMLAFLDMFCNVNK